MPYPAHLHVVEHPPEGGWNVRGLRAVVLVHGTLDRASSFNRVVRRVRAAAPDVAVVAYDRRGYGASRGTASGGLEEHVADLLAVVAHAPAAPAAAVGHSLGGTVVLAAASREPSLLRAVGAFEPPLPWFGFRRRRSGPPSWSRAEADPGLEAERFFRRMVSDEAWERLPERARTDRRAEGPAVLADLRSFGGPPPFDLAALKVPAVLGRGGPQSQPHHREATGWAAGQIPGARLVEFEGAAHGAHLSHPDAFAAFVLAVLAAGTDQEEPPA